MNPRQIAGSAPGNRSHQELISSEVKMMREVPKHQQCQLSQAQNGPQHEQSATSSAVIVILNAAPIVQCISSSEN